ncbi:EscU/YscU/HrcU family type III secretion system export apparatus switch protein, partial [Acinetobacter baumannii]
RHLFRLVFVPMGAAGDMENALSTVFGAGVMLLVQMVLPLFSIPLAIVVAGVIPGGFVASGKNLQPKFSRFSPITNLGNLFSQKHWVGFFTSLGKAVMLGVV